jgi:hypothetical protein
MVKNLTRTAEAVAWFAVGGERGDWRCELPSGAKRRMAYLWLGWEINRQKKPRVTGAGGEGR